MKVQEKSLEVGKLKDGEEDEIRRPSILPYTGSPAQHCGRAKTNGALIFAEDKDRASGYPERSLPLHFVRSRRKIAVCYGGNFLTGELGSPDP
jgi:hypothetical protein